MGWTIRDLNAGRSKRLFSSPNRSDRLWGPPSLLCSGCWCYFQAIQRPRRKVAHEQTFSAKSRI